MNGWVEMWLDVQLAEWLNRLADRLEPFGREATAWRLDGQNVGPPPPCAKRPCRNDRKIKVVGEKQLGGSML
jgi:hypothetical protein